MPCVARVNHIGDRIGVRQVSHPSSGRSLGVAPPGGAWSRRGGRRISWAEVMRFFTSFRMTWWKPLSNSLTSTMCAQDELGKLKFSMHHVLAYLVYSTLHNRFFCDILWDRLWKTIDTYVSRIYLQPESSRYTVLRTPADISGVPNSFQP